MPIVVGVTPAGHGWRAHAPLTETVSNAIARTLRRTYRGRVIGRAKEARSSLRRPVSLSTTMVVAGVEHAGTIIDLSIGGARIVCDARWISGAQLAIAFSVPKVSDVIEVEAIVRWSDSVALGVQFGALRARDMWALPHFLTTLRPLAPTEDRIAVVRRT